MNRYAWLERELDREDLTDEEFNTLNKEINDLQSVINESKAQKKKLTDEEAKQRIQDELNAKALEITDEEVDQMYAQFIQQNAGQFDEHGRTFEQWLNISVSLYEISPSGNEVTLISKAKSDRGFVWTGFVSVAHARTKILELITIKFRDHHKREDRDGCDFANIPDAV